MQCFLAIDTAQRLGAAEFLSHNREGVVSMVTEECDIELKFMHYPFFP